MTGSQNDDSFELNCFLLGEKAQTTFPIPVFPGLKVVNLIPEIRRGYHYFTMGRRLSSFALYQVEATISERAKLQVPPENSHALRLIDSVEDYWPDSSQIHRHHAHILIKPDIVVAQEHPQDSVERSDIERLASRQDKIAERFRDAPSTLLGGGNEEFREQQALDEIAIYNGRPYERTQVPVEVFHPAFKLFATHLKKAANLSAAMYTAVENVMFSSQEFYGSDTSRWRVLEKYLVDAIQHSIDQDETYTNKSGGVMLLTKEYWGYKPYGAIIQVANELGASNFDPSVEGAKSYARYWSRRQMAGLRRATCCPSLIISFAGPWMCVFGAVYLEHVVVQPLTDLIWLGCHPQQDRHTRRVACIFNAITATISALDEYYSRFVQPDLSLPSDHQRFFPYIRSVQTPDGPIHFSYKRRLGESDILRPLFEATTDDGRRIVVKFTEFYNFGAHTLLADRSLAPKLLSLSAELVGESLFMIVMEFSGTSLDHYLDSYPRLDLDRVRTDVQEAVELLHAHDFVFGDLRPPNVLVTQAADGTLRGKLVDFEWCGLEGEARYPIGMNESSDLGWAAGVGKGSLMFKLLLGVKAYEGVGG